MSECRNILYVPLSRDRGFVGLARQDILEMASHALGQMTCAKSTRVAAIL